MLAKCWPKETSTNQKKESVHIVEREDQSEKERAEQYKMNSYIVFILKRWEWKIKSLIPGLHSCQGHSSRLLRVVNETR